MKTINNFDDCLHYVNNMGFAGGGVIVQRQENLCTIADKLRDVSGQNSWHNLRPFHVQFKRGDHGAWSGCFIVENVNNHKFYVHYCDNNSTYEYIPVNSLCGGWHKPVNDPYHSCVVCNPSEV